MKDFRNIAVFVVLVGAVPLFTDSGVMLNFVMTSLYACLLSQAWNVLGGFGGQFSFGHALFFGTGAYVQAIAQMQWGLSPWVALPLAMAFAAGVGAFVGAASFRYGLKGSYFALVTLAFAEVFRILATSVPFTGAGVGLMLPLKESAANMQFGSRAGFIWLMLGLVTLALCITAWLRHSRFGAYLQAVRDNEDAARAIGVNPFSVKLIATILSGGLMGAGGAFYVQVFQYIDPGIAFGAHTSVEALVGAIVGGMGTLWGPLLGAVSLHILADVTRNLFGQLPGINMVIYGVVLIVIVMFLPRGIAGLGTITPLQWLRGQNTLLQIEGVGKSFGGLKAVQNVSLSVTEGRLSALIGPNGAGKTTLFALMSGFLTPDTGRVVFAGLDITGQPPHLNARMGLTRTFQIVQPFAAQTVRENIAVGAHLHLPRRAQALEFAESVASQVGLTPQLDKLASDLTVAGRKRLELARALATRPRLLLLDEVLAGLNPQEIAEMIPVVQGIAQSGVTVLMIEHVMQAVMSLAQEVWVLAQGQLIAQGTPAEVTNNKAVVEAYLGHGTAERLQKNAAQAKTAQEGLKSGYGVVEVLRGVDLQVMPGELVALLGSNGAGKTTLNLTLSGLVAARAGQVGFDGQDITGLHSRQVVQHGLIQVPEGRKVFPNLSVHENLELGAFTRGRERKQQNLDKVYETFPRLKERVAQLAGTLSGGEQQMLAIGRGLMAEPRLLILDEPSLGLSPLLVEELFGLISQLRSSGLAILLVEQNVGQSLDIADRAYVMENGQIRFSGTPAELLASDTLRQAYLGM
eukprot:gene21490-27525_t